MNNINPNQTAAIATPETDSASTTNKNTVIKLLIFDMGKVFIHFDWGRTYDAFVEITKRDLEKVKTAFAAVYFPYERGHITTQDVIDHLNKELESNLTVAEFSALWTSTLDEDKEMTQLLQTLRATKLPMYLLSNINETSFGHLQNNFNVSQHFDELVLSYEVGHIKPAPEIYHEVLNRSKMPAENCLFIDDMKENIEAARAIGINAIHFNGISNLKNKLKEFGISI
jgi:epoxide hydrolase-like predicted phosphatase